MSKIHKIIAIMKKDTLTRVQPQSMQFKMFICISIYFVCVYLYVHKYMKRIGILALEWFVGVLVVVAIKTTSIYIFF